MIFPDDRVINLQPGQAVGHRQPLELGPYPITLYINRESRQETLRHYHILAPHELDYDEWDSHATLSFQDQVGGRPASASNPLVDSVRLSYFQAPRPEGCAVQSDVVELAQPHDMICPWR